MNKKITVQNKEEVNSGFGKDNRAWHKYKYTTDQGDFYMFDNLEVGKEYEIESYLSKGRDGKEYTNWGLPKKGKNNEKLDEILKLLKWLVKNHPNYPQKSNEPGDRQIEY